MYNEILKRRFISEYTKSDSHTINCMRVFNVSEKIESLYGKDIYMMSVKEVSHVLREISGSKYSSATTKRSIVNSYLKWCSSNGLCTICTDTESITVDIDRGYYVKNHMVSNPIHLNIILDSILDDVNMKTVDVLYRCFMWMAFLGISFEDTVKITKHDIALETNEISYNNTIYKMYYESIAAFKYAISLTEFSYYNPHYVSSEPILKIRASGNEVLTGMTSSPTAIYYKTEFSRKNSLAVSSGKTSSSISFQRVRSSGMFYKMFMLESSGIKSWFSDVLTQYYNKPFNKKSILSDYYTWKETFY